MSPSPVSGYFVVDAPRAETPYRGIDRQPWDLVESHYYARQLPHDLLHEFERIRSAEHRGLWWPICTSRAAAAVLLEYSESQGRRSELVAVWSPYLGLVLGDGAAPDPEIVPVGIDVVTVGEWSLLRALQECPRTSGGNAVRELLNPYGLLSNASDVRVVEETYRALAEEGVVEPIAEANSGLPVEAVTIFLAT